MNFSKQLFSRAKHKIPGGVNSPVRSFKGVDGDPVFIKCGIGPYLVDVDDHQYIDFVGSWGPMILGHAHPMVVEKVKEALYNGFSYGAPTEVELNLAEKICTLLPSIEMIRFVNSGTEAAMSAIRLAKGYTKRHKIIKFAGCYHGHVDSLLVAAGSGALTFAMPNSAGVTENVANETYLLNFNAIDEVKALFAERGDEIAAIIVEPVAGNMNCILPKSDFLSGLRSLCDEYQSLLIFDEVMTGFRVAKGGAQSYFNVKPDLTILGKVIGGGFPVGAFGGRAEIMQYVAPLGPVYQAGTLAGNPIAMTAGLATLSLIDEPNFYENLQTKSSKLTTELKNIAQKNQIDLFTNAIGGMFGFIFTADDCMENENQLKKANHQLFKKFFHGMLAEGVYLPPSPFETCFMSSAHSTKDIAETLSKAEKVFASLMVS